jgi:hypothetical protein
MSRQGYESRRITPEDEKLMGSLNKLDVKAIRAAMEEWELEQEKCRERLERMRMMVLSLDDLMDKYNEFDPFVKDSQVILKTPLPAEYISRYIFDCNSLGFKAVIDSTGDCFYNATH